MILTHYYHRNDQPFNTLSSLTEEEALRVVSGLGGRTGAVYRRFSDSKKYLRQRRETEIWVRREFIRKGGNPTSDYPQYFTVGRSVWIEEGYNGQSSMIHLPISAFQPGHISFTYPDSMVSYWLRSQTDKVFYRSEFHGQVFLLSEIHELINKFGVPNEEWKTEEARKYDLFIEAQLWGSIPELASIT
jgi:hypothetical protein